jgi:hypothetical protein
MISTPTLMIVVVILSWWLTDRLKSDAFPINIPPNWRPVVATALCALGGVGVAVLQGLEVREAVRLVVLAMFAPTGANELGMRVAAEMKKRTKDPQQ